MEQSIEYGGLTAPRPRRWARETPAVAEESEGPKVAFRLLLVFLLLLYSNVSLIYQLDNYRPNLIIAVAALAMMVIELARSGRSFRLMWPQSAMVLAFFGACVISTPVSIYISHALDQTSDVGKIVLVYLLLENVVTSEKRLRTIMFTLVIGGLFPAFGTISHYQSGILVEHTRAAWRGIFGNPNEDAYALIVLVPIAMALASKSRWLIRIALWGVIAVYMLAIFLTFSRGGLIALFAVIGLMGWKQKSMVIKVGMVAALIAGIAVIGMFWTRNSGNFNNIKQDTTVQERLATFQAGGLMFFHNPILGVGPGDSMVAYPLYVPRNAHCGCQDQLIVHNSFIQVLGELGLAGFIPFMIFIFASIYQAWKLESGPVGGYAMALGLAMWGFVMCSLSGGFTYSWWPYIVVGLIAAAKRISDSRTEILQHGV